MKAASQIAEVSLALWRVEVMRNRRRLRELGRDVAASDLWRSEWLVHEAEITGLGLFPPGPWPQLRYVVDLGANEGQWTNAFLDLISPEKLHHDRAEPGRFRRSCRKNLAADRTSNCITSPIGATNGDDDASRHARFHGRVSPAAARGDAGTGRRQLGGRE